MTVQYTEPLDRTFHALGDATRRGMLAQLAKSGECTASELGEPFSIAQPTASKHIRVLEQAGLVSRRVTGRTHQFRLERNRMDEAGTWIARHLAFWNASLDALDELLKNQANKGPRE